MSKYWCLKTTFFKKGGYITQYGEMRNIKPKTKEEFNVMVEDELKKYRDEGENFCYSINRARKPNEKRN